MRVHLLRHGEVENPERVRYGRLAGFPLSAKGRDEVRRASEALAERVTRGAISMVVSSPLTRAEESANILRSIAGASEIRFDPRLLEAAEWREGLPRRLTLGPLVSRLLRPATWPESERPLAIARRVHASILDALDRWGHLGDVVLVSHQTPIRLGRMAFERDLVDGTDGPIARLLAPMLSRYPCETASVTTLEVDGRRLVRAEYTPARGAR